jgi:hypothetical protein
MKKSTLIFLVLILIAALAGGGFWIWYQSTLQKSLDERKQTQSRIIEPKKETPTKPSTQIKNEETPSQIPTTQNTSTQPTWTQVKSGNFVTLDPAHYASGKAKIAQDGSEYFVELSEDFKTNPDGPDLYVWLVKEQKLGLAIGGVDTNPETYLNLGPLEKKEGSARYKITKEEAEKYGYAVVIWCRAFGVQFSNAVLTK